MVEVIFYVRSRPAAALDLDANPEATSHVAKVEAMDSRLLV